MAVHCCFELSDALSIFEAKWFLRESTMSRFALRQACLYLTLMFSSLVAFHRFSNFLRLRLASCASGDNHVDLGQNFLFVCDDKGSDEVMAKDPMK